MSNQLAVIKDQLELIRPDFEQLNLTGLSFHKEVEFAVQILAKNNYLAGSNINSIQNSIRNIALTGLSLNPVLKYCYLIPRKEKGQLQCVAEPSYMGLCKILTDTGSVVGISATIVYEKEAPSLKIKQGMNGHASHDAYIGFDKPGKPVACYSIAVLPNGMEHIELLRPWEWEDIKLRSESVKSFNAKTAKGEYAAPTSWLTDTEEMIRKTCIKKHYKYLPKTERAEQIGHAIDLDNQANGIDFEKQQQEKKVQTVSVNEIDYVDPENEEDIKAYQEVKALFESDILPNKVKTPKGEISIPNSLLSMTTEFAEGKLTKIKLGQWLKFIKGQVEFFTANPINKEEGESTEEETQEF